MADKKPEWVKMKPSEVEAIVIDLAKQGETPEKMGLILRDKHGVPKTRLVGKKLIKIIREAKIVIPSQKERLQKKMATLETHIAKNKHDYTAQRSLNKKMWTVQKA